VTREPSGEIFNPAMDGPDRAGASKSRAMVSSAAWGAVATAQATSAGTKQPPEVRDSGMTAQPIADFVELGDAAQAHVGFALQDILPCDFANREVRRVEALDLIALD